MGINLATFLHPIKKPPSFFGKKVQSMLFKLVCSQSP